MKCFTKKYLLTNNSFNLFFSCCSCAMSLFFSILSIIIIIAIIAAVAIYFGVINVKDEAPGLQDYFDKTKDQVNDAIGEGVKNIKNTINN